MKNEGSFAKTCLRIIVVILGLGVLGGCDDVPLLLNEDDKGSTIELQVGDSFFIVLPYYPSTGYAWKLNNVDPDIIHNIKYTQVPPDQQSPGSPAPEIWEFQAIAKGMSPLEMSYEKDGGIESTFEITVVVRSDPQALDDFNRFVFKQLGEESDCPNQGVTRVEIEHTEEGDYELTQTADLGSCQDDDCPPVLYEETRLLTQSEIEDVRDTFSNVTPIARSESDEFCSVVDPDPCELNSYTWDHTTYDDFYCSRVYISESDAAVIMDLLERLLYDDREDNP